MTTRADPAALHRAGMKAVRRGRVAEGRAMLETAVAARPNARALLADLAQVQLVSGDEAAATETYRRALAVDPGFAAGWLNLGILQMRADRIDEAGDCFECAIGIEPTMADALAGLGVVRQRQHRLPEAAEALARAVEAAPGDAEIRSNLGGVLHEMGEIERAAEAFEAALRIAPDRAALHTHLGVLRHEAAGPEAGLAHYEAALRLTPGDARTLAAKHAALFALGRREDAARIFDFPALIQTVEIPAPPGYPDLAAFNAALAAHAETHPTLTMAPLGRTTRGGGQTGYLFGAESGPTVVLERLIRDAIDAYFADPVRAGHPHGPRKPERSRIDAWATVLDSGGYQDPHIHPSGVLSGVYYPKVSDTGEAGAIEFGRPAAPFTLDAPEVMTVRPHPGLLVLFPSFVWHRTIPFEGTAKRISIAFDLIPVD
ncbi:MAG: putative 2OG-Fe(II) oxygenase [Paracoccaceae bacterium]